MQKKPSSLWCIVSQPNSTVLEVEVDQKADGRECLEKVCEKLGIIETDYFGLQYLTEKGETLWVNLRNVLSDQLCGPTPYRLRLRVKFFVQPQYLLLEITRQQFYSNIKDDFCNNRLRIGDESTENKMAALIAQVETGDFAGAHSAEHYEYLKIAQSSSAEALREIVREHQALRGLTPVQATYQLLQCVAELPCYGMEMFTFQNKANVQFYLGVGPAGMFIYSEEWALVRKIEYPTISMATQTGKCLFLHTRRDDASTVMFQFRLVSESNANALYRAVTETYSFYRCDTVQNAVAAQFCRDLKGTLASFFNEKTSLGKKYVFDIQRTFREAYDRARRTMYSAEQSLAAAQLAASLVADSAASMESSANSPNVGGDSKRRKVEPMEAQNLANECCERQSCDDITDEDSLARECQLLRERLQMLQDAQLCSVCMQVQIDTAFSPCGHVTCCQKCAQMLDICPLCRSHIINAQRVFLPCGIIKEEIPVATTMGSRPLTT